MMTMTMTAMMKMERTKMTPIDMYNESVELASELQKVLKGFPSHKCVGALIINLTRTGYFNPSTKEHEPIPLNVLNDLIHDFCYIRDKMIEEKNE